VSIASSIAGGGSGGASGLSQGAGTTIADNQVVRGDTPSGLQGSGVSISDAAAVSGVTLLDVDNLRLDGNTISSSNANGNVVFDPNGSGLTQVQGTLQIVDSGLLVYTLGGDEKVQVAGGTGGTLFSSDTDIRWYNDADISSGVSDAGLKRAAAGKLQGTNGSSGALAAFLLTSTVGIYQGTGDPEGAATAGVGSLYLRTDGGAGSSLYVKESGAGNTGWKAALVAP
jgi:hypothetical protein